MADRSERKERLVAALSDTFRTHGYGGASVAVLARAAGLSKASLYHHFPGGKEAMAAAVLEAAEARLEAEMLTPLAGDTPLPERVDAMMAAVEEHHGGGCEPGIFGQFSQVGADHPFAAPVAAFYGRWIASLADALSENGVESEEAVCRAADVVMVVEGALLLSRVLADPGPLHRVRRHLPSTIAEGG
ncbi:MAG TPA: TetR/AcrR family transcriptional regulator [Alphaproteobacteria bacterium]|jgi:AcrR family transcriptional regulator|nr:TetR/AcrR family transcriptional regulator [Alphaproteobacteria bacterium]